MSSFWQDRSVYLTGGTGFIGGLMAKRMLDGGAKLTVLTREAKRAQHLVDLGSQVDEGDITEPSSLGIPEDVDTVVHGAAWVAFGIPRQKRELFMATHVDGTKHVLEAAKQAGANRFCHLSSVVAVGPTPAGLYSEERVTKGRVPTYHSIYEEAKHQAHLHVLENKGDLRVTIPMPGVVLGPHGEFGMLERAFLKGRMWDVRGDNPTGFVHVKDTVDGILLAIEKGTGPYLLVDENLTIHGLLQRFAEASGRPAPTRSLGLRTLKALAWMVQLPYHLRGKVAPLSTELVGQLELPFTYTSQKAVKELGWQPDLPGRLEADFDELMAG